MVPSMAKINCTGRGVSLGTSQSCINISDAWMVVPFDKSQKDIVVPGTKTVHDDSLLETVSYLIHSVGLVGTFSSMYVLARIFGVKVVMCPYQYQPNVQDVKNWREEGVEVVMDPTPENIVKEVKKFLNYDKLEVIE